MDIYLQAENLTKSYGESVMFSDISFSIEEGMRIGLIGRNGCGKTTLLNIIDGRDGYDSGKITVKRDLKIGYLEQDPSYPGNLTVMQACFLSENETINVIADYEKAVISGDSEKLDRALAQMDRLKAWDYEHRIKQILTKLEITNLECKISELSGGQVKRVALANVLILEPELLILDEPTNHLDLDMTEWLEEYLSRGNITLLMITHDRYFLAEICSEIFEIDDKKIYRYKGNYSYYVEKRQERIEARNAETERAGNLLRIEAEWMRRQPQARATKAKYRVDAYYELKEKAGRIKEQGNVKLEVKSAYIGSKIFEAKHVFKSYGDLKILDDFNYVFSRYEKTGIVGNNGTGKSTFVKMLAGEVKPDRGVFDVGKTVKFGYYSQTGLNFSENDKVIDIVRNIAEYSDLGNGRLLSASQFLQHFLFSPQKQHDFVGKLSGGERRRLYLCTVLMGNPNFLMLDEPTNDLDIMTLNVLEEYIQAFKGCVIVVSHDRYFVDKTVDRLLVFKGNAEIKEFPGNYSDYRKYKELAEKTEKDRNVKPDNKGHAKKNANTETKKKLAYKERRELEALEKEIAELEVEKAELENDMIDGNLSHNELTVKSNRIGTVIKLIDEKTDRWLELSMLC